MLISHKHKFIFLHNYKVAGMSITKALSSYALVDSPKTSLISLFIDYCGLNNIFNGLTGTGLDRLTSKYCYSKHINASELKDSMPDKHFNRYFKFGFVRNPWDWQVSLYSYMKNKVDHHQHHLIKNMSFEDYIEWRVNEDLHLQKSFFYDSSDNCLVDFIGKLENIESEVEQISKKINIKINLPHVNKSKRKRDYKTYYNSNTRKMIEQHFEEDIRLFNYQY